MPNIRDPGKAGYVVKKLEPTTDNQIGRYSRGRTQELKYFEKQNSIINDNELSFYMQWINKINFHSMVIELSTKMVCQQGSIV